MGSKSSESPKSEWVGDLPSGPPEKVERTRLLEEAPVGDSDYEDYEYQRVTAPSFETVESQQRRFRGQFRRRLKRLTTKSRHDRTD